jgi:hypothetical protein
LITVKGIKFPSFNRRNLQKFFEGCLESYEENQENWSKLTSTIKINDWNDWVLFHKGYRKLKSENKLEAYRVLSEACNQDDRVLIAILASYARVCIEGDKGFSNFNKEKEFVREVVSRLQSPCWFCELVNMGLDDFFCNYNSCPASSYCFGGADLELEAYTRNVVLAVCRSRGCPSVWRFLPYVSDFDHVRTKFEETLRIKFEPILRNTIL